MKKYKKLVILFAFIFTLISANQTFASVVWEENFDNAIIDHKGATGSGGGGGAVLDMASVTKWTISTISGDANLSAATDWFRVQNNKFQGRDLDVDSLWETEIININGYSNIHFQLDASETGTLEGGTGASADYLDIYYDIDNAGFTRIPNWATHGDANHTFIDDWTGPITVTQNIPDGSASLKIRVLMKNGAGAERINIDNIQVIGNNIPVVSDLGSTLNFTEGDADIVIDPSITIMDNDDINMEEASITITGNYQNGEDSLVYVDTATIIGVWDVPTATLDLLGTDTKANYEIALESIKYSNATSPITTLDRTITWKVNDGDINSAGITSTISINSTPTDIKLDAADSDSVDENTLLGTVISALTTLDSDAADIHTYSLVAGVGGEDNAKFNVTGTNLVLNFTPDFENPTDLGDTAGNNTYSIRLQTDDGNGGSYQESFIITINDLNIAPTDIGLSSLNINEGIAANTFIGTLSNTDDGEDSYIYTLPVFGDNADFSITGTDLKINAIPDFETKASYSIKVNVNDGVHNFEKIFTITVNDLDENIPVISLLGSPTLTLTVGDVYVDAGATANDDIDGDITGSIITVNPVNTTIAGTYIVTYNVSDSSANAAIEVTRIIEVVEPAQTGRSHGSKRVSKKRLAEIFGEKELTSEIEQEIKPNEQENNLCSAEKLIHENMKSGDRNGIYSSWQKGTISEVKILQAHMNRLGFNAGYVDGILGPITDSAIKRMQRSLGFTGKLVDGYVGALTREAINHSC